MQSNTTEHQPSHFKLFHDLMHRKVERILLISTSYEAWIMEEDCRLSEKIIHEYRGLNLSHPPRLTWASSLTEALEHLKNGKFDLVITISSTVNPKAIAISDEVKRHQHDMPVVLLTHQEVLPEIAVTVYQKSASIDLVFHWSGNADILVAIIKCIEDRLNVHHDTQYADVRVIIYVEDSPFYLSTILPVLYKELVIETQSVIDDGLNEEHRLLYMRARPKIITTHSLEDALDLYKQFKPYVLGVISDVRFPSKGALDAQAGYKLLTHVKQDRFDIPLLMTSSESENADLAKKVPASFMDKNSPALQEEIESFLMGCLGFGNFHFLMPDGQVISQATDLYSLEQRLNEIPDDSFIFHVQRNDFSRWLFSLCEMELAAQIRILRDDDFDSIVDYRQHVIQMIRRRRLQRQKGVIVNFDKERFDPDTEFLKIGKGSLGGKARGLGFISSILHANDALRQSFGNVEIYVPQTIVITTEGFDSFIDINQLGGLVKEDLSDETIAKRFMAAEFPRELKSQLATFLEQVHYPLAVRSSSLLEDAQFKAYAGLYQTYMIPNDLEDLNFRLDQLINAIKMIYASTYFEAPRTFSERVGNRIESEKMAIIIQQIVGSHHGKYYYPSISGVAQSMNYYPFSKMKSEEGIVSIALGLGKAVMGGEKNLRFSPRYPNILPQRSTVDDILQYSQRYFYALKVNGASASLGVDETITLSKREIKDAIGEHPVRILASTYESAEHRIQDSFSPAGHPVMTFASILKHKTFPLAEIIEAILAIGQDQLDCPVEMEFAVDLPADRTQKTRFAILQIRPMSSREEMLEVEITESEESVAFCVSHQALGNTVNTEMLDLIYVNPETFDASQTKVIASEIGEMNAKLFKEKKRYILVGPGRWGSSDPWLGIPIRWEEICGVGAIIECTHPAINAEPSQGSHFFHNMTTLGINYLNVGHHATDRLNWDWVGALKKANQTKYVVHATVKSPFLLKVDGRQRLGVLLGSLNSAE